MLPAGLESANLARKTQLLTLLSFAAVGLPIALGHDGTRLLQLVILSLPGWLWLVFRPARTRHYRTLQACIVAGSGALFILDGSIRGFITSAYQASPAGAMVLTAISNTSAQESWEFLVMHWPSLAAWKGLTLACLLLLGWALWQWRHLPPHTMPKHKWSLCVQFLLLAVVVLALAHKPWRKYHPVAFWSSWATEVHTLRDNRLNLAQTRQHLLSAAAKQAPRLTTGSPDTVVLVLGESINRSHLGLYGYPRHTTPELENWQRTNPEKLGVFRHAWSVDASTVLALRNLFYFGQADDPQQHLLALAAAAGYETWWISNHDDLGIEQEHGKLARHIHMLNRIPGRSAQSLDAVTLPVLKQALMSTAPRKLIVLHLLGAHPYYKLRFPQTQTSFIEPDDAVDRALAKQGRSPRARNLRNNYDSAIRYHDSVLAATLDLTRQYGGRAVWVYLSDHGQDVVSKGSFAGHSNSTAEGYRIPLLLWGDSVSKIPPEIFGKFVRSDWLAYSLMDILGVAWPGQRDQKNVLNPGYEWIPPPLPIAIDFGS